MSDLAIEKLPFAGSARFVASQEANPLDRPFFGHTAIGSAIKTAVSENSLSNKAASRLAATGTIESVIINNCDKNDEGIDQICSLVNLSKDFLFTATYILDASSAAAFKLFSAVARKQADNPNYRCFIAYNSLSSSSTSQIKKLAELTHANISLAKHKNGFSRASQHQKLFILDRERAALGGDNIDNPEEADMLITVRGPIVRNLIREAMLTWQTCHDFQYAPGTNLQTFLQSMLLSPDKTTATKQDTAMLTLNKSGINLLGNYYQNPIDAGLFSAIDNAKESINIMSPNINDAELLKHLQSAANRGVHIKILVPKSYEAFSAWFDRAGNYITMIFRAHLSDETKKNFEVRWYSDDNKKLCANHTKFYSVDNTVVFIGSLNGDNQSLAFSRELLLAIEDPDTAKELNKKVFESAWNTSIPAKEHCWHELLPVPGHNLFTRFITTISIPWNIIKFGLRRTKQWLTTDYKHSKLIAEQ